MIHRIKSKQTIGDAHNFHFCKSFADTPPVPGGLLDGSSLLSECLATPTPGQLPSERAGSKASNTNERLR